MMTNHISNGNNKNTGKNRNGNTNNKDNNRNGNIGKNLNCNIGKNRNGKNRWVLHGFNKGKNRHGKNRNGMKTDHHKQRTLLQHGDSLGIAWVCIFKLRERGTLLTVVLSASLSKKPEVNLVFLMSAILSKKLINVVFRSAILSKKA